MTSNTVNLETELSPKIIGHFKERGYCVHGEVSIFGKSEFIDHVAHTGPCENPEHVIAIEMKRGADKSLRKQVRSLDSYHVADEIWGAVFTLPQERTLKKWHGCANWVQPGLLVLHEDRLVDVIPPNPLREYKRHMFKKKLLLIPDNREVIAGYPSSHIDLQYHTHYSCVKKAALTALQESSEALDIASLLECAPKAIQCYSKPKAALRSVLKSLEDEGYALGVKEGRRKVYSYTNPEPKEEEDVWDSQFEDMLTE